MSSKVKSSQHSQGSGLCRQDVLPSDFTNPPSIADYIDCHARQQLVAAASSLSEITLI
jgi:hypothetical protein